MYRHYHPAPEVQRLDTAPGVKLVTCHNIAAESSSGGAYQQPKDLKELNLQTVITQRRQGGSAGRGGVILQSVYSTASP